MPAWCLVLPEHPFQEVGGGPALPIREETGSVSGVRQGGEDAQVLTHPLRAALVQEPAADALDHRSRGHVQVHQPAPVNPLTHANQDQRR